MKNLLTIGMLLAGLGVAGAAAAEECTARTPQCYYGDQERSYAPGAYHGGVPYYGGVPYRAAPYVYNGVPYAYTNPRWDRDGDGVANRRDRDRDGDGVRNRHDRDRDGDGVVNRNDRHPNNPNRR